MRAPIDTPAAYRNSGLGPWRAPGGATVLRVLRPVFSKTGIDSDRDDGFNSVAVAAAVWYEL